MTSSPRVPVFGGAKTAGWPKSKAWAKRWQYFPLSVALSADFDADAHFCPYSVPRYPYRLTSDAPKHVGGVPLVAAVFDVDAPAEEKVGGVASEIWRQYQWGRIADLLDAHPGGFIYFTRGGYRIVYLLREPFVIHGREEAEAWYRLYMSWLCYLARAFDIYADPKCRDWTRLYRLPHVTRTQGTIERFDKKGDPRAIGFWEYSPDEDAREEDLAAARNLAEKSPAWKQALRWCLPPRSYSGPAADFSPVDPLEISDEEFGQIGNALIPHLAKLEKRGGAFRALVGALLRRGFPAEKIEPLFEVMSRALQEEESKTRERCDLARRKIADDRNGTLIAGLGVLREEFPDLFVALDEVLPDPRGAKAAQAEAQARGVFDEVSPEEAGETLAETLRNPPAGLTVVKVTEGTGKSRKAREIAAERAKKGLKTLVIVPSHKVGREAYVEPLRAAGVPVFHRLSVLSVLNSQGHPECRFHEALSTLAAGGHKPVPFACLGVGRGKWGLDDECPHLNECEAFRLQLPDPPPGVLVVVAVREYLLRLMPWIGHDLVILDEDPGTVEAVTVTAEDLSFALDAGDSYQGYEQWRVPVLQALKKGLETLKDPEKGEPGEPLLALFRRGCSALRGDKEWQKLIERFYPDEANDPEKILRRYARDCAYREDLKKPGEWKKKEEWPPLLSRHVVQKMRRGALSEEETRALRRGSETHATLAQAAAALYAAPPEGAISCAVLREKAVCSLEKDEAGVLLRVVRWAAGVGEALSRPAGATVLLDATAQEPLIKALAPSARFVTVRVKDGAKISRVLLHVAHAAKKHLLCEGDVNWKKAGPYLRAALDEALSRLPSGIERPRVAVIGWRPFHLELSQAWEHGGYPEAQKALSTLRARGGELVLPPRGYYGNLRSRNDWLENGGVDALITFGDPRPNLPAAKAIAAALGLAAEHDEVYALLTKGELSQAHGRYRAPHRDRALVAIHVGKFLPASWDARAEVKTLSLGRRKAHSAEEVKKAVAETGSLREAAHVLGLAWNSTTLARLKEAKSAESQENPEKMGVVRNRLEANISDSHFRTTPIEPCKPAESQENCHISSGLVSNDTLSGGEEDAERWCFNENLPVGFDDYVPDWLPGQSTLTHPQARALPAKARADFEAFATLIELERGITWRRAQEEAWREWKCAKSPAKSPPRLVTSQPLPPSPFELWVRARTKELEEEGLSPEEADVRAYQEAVGDYWVTGESMF